MKRINSLFQTFVLIKFFSLQNVQNLLKEETDAVQLKRQ